ncbi:hypothetical protein SeMB42_g02065 [Synchytrium endobioticum]|uniref:PB1 domain-containing protein n=1 Tax=Synchytrium endobioticum TaxID=286115 RepID=A0A507DJ88_9FUNG|nr:hypothetical protein SeMB42_g02065 [Synchytrium endobioticum]
MLHAGTLLSHHRPASLPDAPWNYTRPTSAPDRGVARVLAPRTTSFRRPSVVPPTQRHDTRTPFDAGGGGAAHLYRVKRDSRYSGCGNSWPSHATHYRSLQATKHLEQPPTPKTDTRYGGMCRVKIVLNARDIIGLEVSPHLTFAAMCERADRKLQTLGHVPLTSANAVTYFDSDRHKVKLADEDDWEAALSEMTSRTLVLYVC